MLNYEVVQEGATLGDIEDRVKQLISQHVYSFAQRFSEGIESSTQAGRHLVYTSIMDTDAMGRSIRDAVYDKLEQAIETHKLKPQVEEVTFYWDIAPMPTITTRPDYNTDTDRLKGPLYVYFAHLPYQQTEQSIALFVHYTQRNSEADHVTVFDYEPDDDSDDELPELETDTTEEDIPELTDLTIEEAAVNVNL